MTKSLRGHLFYVTFIDDHSRKTRVYLLKSKDEVFSKFQEFKAEVLNFTERKIKTLRSDNGGEYTSKEVVAFCKEAGIKRELIVPYNPKQNGLVERKDKSIEESVKAILHDQDLPKFLWGEATKDKRKKLDPTSKKGIFVGYSYSSKAYRIYIKEGHQIEVSRDVIFDANIAFKKSKDISSDSNEEDLPIFEEEVNKEEEDAHQEDEGPSKPITIPQKRKRPNWLTSTLQDAERHQASGKFRESKKPKRYSGYAAYMSKLIKDEPSKFEEASKHSEWMFAMNEEYQSIMKNGVWEIVPGPENKFVVTSKWIYKIKHAGDGRIDKYKARFVARGFSQEEGIDYEETFAPTTRYTTIRSLISLEAPMKWKVHQMDIKATFLNGTIDEEVYIRATFGIRSQG
eukprot:PITA_08095